jgi:transposase-like protein
VETTKQKEKMEIRREKPKPEEQEGMLKHQHCPHAKRHKDRNPKYHEEHHIDVDEVTYDGTATKARFLPCLLLSFCK